jgi:nucleoside triphosphate diphosphatase
LFHDGLARKESIVMNTRHFPPHLGVELNNPVPSTALSDLVALMAALRTPGTGCAWDIEQDFASIAPYTIEEAHEVAEAISRNDHEDLRDELGDLLLQVVFHARIAEEMDLFALPDVIEAISAKLIRRHPHVFSDARHLPPDEVKKLWATIKAQEKLEKAKRRKETAPARERILDGVPTALPATQRALKLQQKAASVGFDWPSTEPVLDKITEELAECRVALEDRKQASSNAKPQATKALAGEIGDLLFAVINLARHAGIDADQALAMTNAKFEQRFAAVEDGLTGKGLKVQEASLEDMEKLWVAAKSATR